jgi:hypothetical protein
MSTSRQVVRRSELTPSEPALRDEVLEITLHVANEGVEAVLDPRELTRFIGCGFFLGGLIAAVTLVVELVRH